jgi:hypothetical protein
MRRAEALAFLGTALLVLVAGLTWLLGAYGLIGSGAVLTAVALLIDWKE